MRPWWELCRNYAQEFGVRRGLAKEEPTERSVGDSERKGVGEDSVSALGGGLKNEFPGLRQTNTWLEDESAPADGGAGKTIHSDLTQLGGGTAAPKEGNLAKGIFSRAGRGLPANNRLQKAIHFFGLKLQLRGEDRVGSLSLELQGGNPAPGWAEDANCFDQPRKDVATAVLFR